MKLISTFLMVIVLISCGDKNSLTKEQVDIEYSVLLKGGNDTVSFVNQARPVLEKRCIVCHGCYDAPCQLKLTSIEGIRRGANPKKVYDPNLFTEAERTRLFIDATTEEQWREKGFHSVLNEQADNPVNNLRYSVFYKILRLKQVNPQHRLGKIDDDIDLSLNRNQTCPTNESFSDYADDFPNQGMPFATPNLTDDEYHTLIKWISQGLPDDRDFNLSDETKNQVDKWEVFFNQNDLKYQLTSRYIYEHLFLGHLHFKGANNREFFRLVRSSTPSGSPIKEIATARPYERNQSEKIYYRLRYVKSSIVNKSHMVYELSDKRMQRYKELFIQPDYQVNKLPSYEAKVAANPFRAFVDIPVKSRYKFLLDDAKFFIEGFIKGPVCRGQVALNVIEDQFWVFFIDPDHLKVNNDNNYLKELEKNLSLPSEEGNTINLTSAWVNYWTLQVDYMAMRQKAFMALPKMQLDDALSFVWDGSDAMDKNNRTLSIFRHFDSATVKQGLIGNYPESAWIMDYPIFERIHYLLVAGYDVYGNVGHQFNTRIYMDFLRMEAEDTFLAMLPPKNRQKIRESWYLGIRADQGRYFDEPKKWLNAQIVSGYKTDDPLRELYKKLEQKLENINGKKDYINRCTESECEKLSKIDKYVQRITKISGEKISMFPETALLKVKSDKHRYVYTLIHNKAYKNVYTLFDDVDNRDKEFDTLTVYKGILGAYPNLFFVVDEAEIEAFSDKFISIKNKNDYEEFVAIYGVRRTSPSFWKEADWFNEQLSKQDPLGYGIFDLNRYNNI